MRCPRCGAMNGPDARECFSCGRELPQVPVIRPSASGSLIFLMVMAVVLSLFIALSLVVSTVGGLVVSASDVEATVGLSFVVNLIGRGGIAVAGMLLVASLLVVVSLILVAVAGVRLHRGDRDLCARIVFVEYVLLVLAALFCVVSSMTDAAGVAEAAGVGFTKVWAWLMLGLCGAVVFTMWYRLFVKRQ